MRSLFYSITVLILLSAFFSLTALIRSQEVFLGDQQAILIEVERIHFLFENVNQDFSQLLNLGCEVGDNQFNVSFILPQSVSDTQDVLNSYEEFIESNYPGSDLHISGLLEDLENDDKYSIIVGGEEIEFNYNVPRTRFDLSDGLNLTFDFPGYTTNITWSGNPSGSIPLCIFTQDLSECRDVGDGGTIANIDLNSTNGTSAGRIRVQVSGSDVVTVRYNLVDFGLIPWIRTTLSFPGTGQPIILDGASLSYELEYANRTDSIRLCE